MINSITENAPPTVYFNDVRVSIGGTDILKGVTAKVPQGSCTAIVGPNGAGKTTLLLTILNQAPYQGSITTNTKDSNTPLRIGYVPQRMTFDRGMPLTVLEFMTMGCQRTPFWFGVKKKYKEKALLNLSAVKADKLSKRRVGALSGGEMQRVLLALALDQSPELLILDEPTAGVDFHGERLFCGLLDDLRREYGFTQLMVNHDLSTVTHHATHVICLNRRVIAEGKPKEILNTATLTELFGVHMGLVNKNAISSRNAYCTGSCCNKGNIDA